MLLTFLLVYLVVSSTSTPDCCRTGHITPCKPCISLCCPTGEIRVINPDWTPNRCDPYESPEKTCAPAKEHHDVDFQTFMEDDVVFDFRHSRQKFSCSGPEETLIISEHVYNETSISDDGTLLAMMGGSGELVNHTTEQYCLAYAEVNDENSTSEIDSILMVCFKGGQHVDKEKKDFTMIFYPCALLISSLFLLLTIISYIMDSDLHRPLFGKITLGFIINLLLTYVFVAAGYIVKQTDDLIALLSTPCMLLGYLSLYFFYSFMFWINAMAASICLKFSAIMAATSDNEGRKFFINFTYAQGLPLVLCITVYLIDSYGSCDWVRPDMAVAQCFIGAPRMELDENISYFKTAEFIYLHGILLVLQITNIIFFLITVYFLVDHWRKSSNLTKTGENKGNFLIVIKLFFIMGIQWLGELISHILTHELGDSNTVAFYFRVIIDCSNLFTGVLVFLVLICKKKTVRRVRSRLQHNSQLSRGSTLTTSTKDTVNWFRDRDLGHRDPRGGEMRLKVFFRQKHLEPDFHSQHEHQQFL